MKTERTYRFIISGGGTGGHIFPAVAIAQELERQFDKPEILFVGADGRMEMEKVPEAGYKIEGLPIAGLQRRLTFKNLLLPLKIGRSIIKARSIIRTFKPDVAIGVGGYASTPVIWVANQLKVPTLIQEQNAYAGLANKLLSKKASSVCVAYENMESYFPKDKISLTGNPVRQLLVEQKAVPNDYGLENKGKCILVVGGSLGSKTINESIAAGLSRLISHGNTLIWQTGKYYFDQYRDLEKRFPHQVKIMPFIKEMEKAYHAADVVISRAGALAVAELAIVGKPVIFIPSPNVAEDHQTKNAKALAAKDAAWVVKDNEAGYLLIDKIMELTGDEATMQKLAKNIAAFARPDAARNIVEQIKLILN